MNRDLSIIKAKVIWFLSNPQPGKVLEIPNLVRLEHLPDHKISYRRYKTGEEQIWQLQKYLQPDQNSVFAAYLANRYSNKHQ